MESTITTQNHLLETKYGNRAITCMFMSTVIQAVFGYARNASPFWKFFIALFCWLSIYYAIKKISIVKKYNKTIRCLVYAIQGIVLLSLLTSIFSGVVYSGEKYVVIFTNMYGILDIVGIFLITAVSNVENLRHLLKITYYMLPLSIVLLLFNYDVAVESYFLTYVLMYASVFLPYVSPRHKIYLLVLFGLSLYAFFFGGGRQAAIIFAFTLASMFLGWWNKPKHSLWASLFIFILTLALVYYSVNYVSVFSLLSDSKESIEGLNSDTRTFLWVELFSDFGNTDLYTQLFGKGCLGYYASDFFKTDHRFGIEVPILQWILQAGWLYIIFLTTIMVTAVIRLCKYGQNKMCLISATLIAGLYFNMYVSNLIGCNLSTIGTWFLIGMAFNDCFLHISDNDLKVQIYDV